MRSGFSFSILASLTLPVAAHLPLIPNLPSTSPRFSEQNPPPPATHRFYLRQIFHHGTHRHPELHRKQDVFHTIDSPNVFIAEDKEDGFEAEALPPLVVSSVPSRIQRLADRRRENIDALVEHTRKHGQLTAMSPAAWTIDTVSGPDVTDKQTILSFAYMSSDAYVEHEGDADWDDVGAPFNRSADFGWEGDGLRGHVFADETNSTIVIGLKGTSPALWDGEGTTTNDKINDNLFFSCCCGQQGQWSWHQVCDCATGPYSCNNTCVRNELQQENRYYTAVKNLYANVTELYPHANVWVTGHSLGGAVASFLGLTYGLPTVTFEAVPDALPAARLGLPMPPGSMAQLMQTRDLTGTYHFGHTADPVYTGTCNGATATCTYAGYAMESVCHSGYECVWDVVADKGWRVGIGTHKIRAVIRDVIMKYDEVPKCQLTPECRDCGNWDMYESNGTDHTTTSSSVPYMTLTRTRTETCKTPGWLGCLDQTTTTIGTVTNTDDVTTTTETSSTSTCKTPGWFGCKDPVSTTTTDSPTATHPITTTLTSTLTTTSCASPGWWGCNDPTTTVTLTSTSTCHTPGWLGCKDKTTTEVTSTTTTEATTTTTCATPGRFYGCNDEVPAATKAAGANEGCIKWDGLGQCVAWRLSEEM